MDNVKHPGFYINKFLVEHNWSQKELSVRTKTSEKHISNLLSEKNSISAAMARKLQYATGISATEWLNYQIEFDTAEINRIEKNNISKAELEILSNPYVKPILEYMEGLQYVTSTTNSEKIIELRGLIGVSDLTSITDLQSKTAYRKQKVHLDVYALHMWEVLCDKTIGETESSPLNLQLLNKKLKDIKNIMFTSVCDIERQLKTILSQCGVTFALIKNFTGVPVQGFIKQGKNNNINLCMTLRQKRADIFWFTLFHEIGHILLKHTEKPFLDFKDSIGKIEEEADTFASNFLFEAEAYSSFIQNGLFDYCHIEQLAKKLQIQPWMIIGRLQHEQCIPFYSPLNQMIEKYSWIDVEEQNM